MSNFSLSDNGRILFKEGAIPTNENKIAENDIYFDPITETYCKEFSHYIKEKAEVGLEDKQYLEQDLQGLEKFIWANPKELGIKPEERIVSVDVNSVTESAYKKDGCITAELSERGVKLNFSSEQEKDFFTKHYSPGLLGHFIENTKKYQFENHSQKFENIPSYKLEDAELHFGEELLEVASRPCKMFFHNGNPCYLNANKGAMSLDVSQILLNAVDPKCEFVAFDSYGGRYFRIYNVLADCDGFDDKVAVPLLVERTLTADKLKECAEVLYKTCLVNEDFAETSRILIYLSTLFHTDTYLLRYAQDTLDGTTDENIELLCELDATFRTVNGWKEIFQAIASRLFEESLLQLTTDNIRGKKVLLDKLKAPLNISDKQYAEQFLQVLEKQVRQEKLYSLLENIGFDPIYILPLSNVVEIYARAVLENGKITEGSDLANRFASLKNSLWTLNGMLGIKSLTDYSITYDFAPKKFFDTYATLKDVLSALETYRIYASKEYAQIDQYLKLMAPSHKLLSEEAESAAHPEKLTKAYIDNEISRGQFPHAVSDLLIKLNWALQQKLHVPDISAAELIDLAEQRGIVSSAQVGPMHKLRKARNNIQHPDTGAVSLNQETLSHWCNMVFEICEGNENYALPLTVYCKNSVCGLLRKANIQTVGDVVAAGKRGLKSIRGISDGDIAEIERTLKTLDIELQ